MEKNLIIILSIYLIGSIILFIYFLRDMLKCKVIITRKDFFKLIIVSLTSWCGIIPIVLTYILDHCENWLNEPLFKHNKKK